jgi:hypothetical protein
MMNVWVYKIYSANQLALLSKQVEHHMADWSTEWMPGTASISACRVVPSKDLPENDRNAPHILVHETEDLWVAFAPTNNFSDNIGRTILRESHNRPTGSSEDSIVSAIISDAIIDLGRRLCGSTAVCTLNLDMENSSHQTVINGTASGCVHLTCAWNNIPVHLSLSREAVARHLPINHRVSNPHPVQLCMRKDSIGRRPVSCHVQLGSATLSVDELSSLQLGDVLRIDQAWDKPLNISINSEAIKLHGYLGKQSGRKAIRITKASQ